MKSTSLIQRAKALLVLSVLLGILALSGVLFAGSPIARPAPIHHLIDVPATPDYQSHY